MNAPLRPDELTSAARSLAAKGLWLGVRQMLRERPEAEDRPELLLLLGEAAFRVGAPEEAQACFERAIPMLVKRGDRVALRQTVNRRGASLFELGRLAEAQQLFEEAVELGEADGDSLLLARATNNLGLIANIRGRKQEALALYQLAVPAYQRLGHLQGLAESYHNMAISYRHLHDLTRAEECERRAIEYAVRVPDARLEAMARVGRAEVLLEEGEGELAEAVARQAVAVFRELPDPVREADATRLCGVACMRSGRIAEATSAFDRAIELAEAHGSTLVAAESYAGRADLRSSHGDKASAVEDARRAVRLFESLEAHGEVERLRRWLETNDRANS